MSTRKKRDTMVAASLPAFNDSPSINAPYTMNASFNATVLGWIATARDNETKTGGPLGNVNDPACRTAKHVFMKGLAERVELFTSSSLPWQWRRVCITLRGFDVLEDNSGIVHPLWRLESNGWKRGLFSMLSANASQIWGNIQTLMFKGQFGTDYFDFINAALDRERVDVHYDKMFKIGSGNQSGNLKQVKLWHGMNKTLIYDDDELDSEEAMQFLSSRSKYSMGDYYVFDIFKPLPGGSASDTLTFNPAATLYWHER